MAVRGKMLKSLRCELWRSTLIDSALSLAKEEDGLSDQWLNGRIAFVDFDKAEKKGGD